ncbi:hypothetical protein ACOSQ4_031380 [Xanthoceras sorbifolium]
MPAIRALDLEDYISPSVSAPPKLIEVLSHDEQGSSTIKHKINPAFAVWKKADQILLCWLLGTLSPSVLGQVTRCITSLEMWTKLERVYSQQSMARILQLRQQLQSIKKGSDSISDFVLKLKNIGDALLEAGEDVSERDLLLALMNGVSHEYDSVVVLISSQQHTMPLDDAQFLFLMHEQRIESLNLHLKNILHVPSITKNLLSISKLTKDNNAFAEFHDNGCMVKDKRTRRILLQGPLRHGIYQLDLAGMGALLLFFKRCCTHCIFLIM